MGRAGVWSGRAGSSAEEVHLGCPVGSSIRDNAWNSDPVASLNTDLKT